MVPAYGAGGVNPSGIAKGIPRGRHGAEGKEHDKIAI